MSVVDSVIEHVADSPVVSKDDLPLLLVLPGLLVSLAFMLFPVLYLVYFSLTNAEPATLFRGKEQWVGFANYVTAFSDGQFQNSMGVMWLLVATSVMFKVLVGLGIGFAVTGGHVRGKRFMCASIIIPLDPLGTLTITIQHGIFSSTELGPTSQFLRMAGLDFIAWSSERWMAFLAYNVTEAWLAYPFMVITTVGASQDVSEELHEVVMIDDAGFFARFLHATFPSIKRPALFASALTTTASFQQLLILYVSNQGGPSRTNELFTIYGYRETFRLQKYGEDAATTLVAVAVIGVSMMLSVKKEQLADGVDDA